MIGVLHASIGPAGKALPVQVSHRFAATSAVFDDDHLVSCAGLVPVMTVAAQTGLPRLLTEKVHIAEPRIKSGSANPAPKLTTLIAGMCAGADCIDDLDVVRSGGMKTLFDGVYAPSTIGVLLREFTFGHARQLESVLREHLAALCERVELLPGADERAFVDIDSLLRPVYGHAKQGASYGHTKIAGKQILRKGLSPLITTISTETSRAGDRRGAAAGGQDQLRQGRGPDDRPGRGHRPGCRGQRADPGARRLGLRQQHRGGRLPACRGPVLTGADQEPRRGRGHRRDPRRPPGPRSSTPVRCATPTPAHGSPMPKSPKSPTPRSLPPRHAVTARLIVRRVKDARYPDALFPVWRYHPFFTDTDEPTAELPISPTAATPSSRPSSPTSSTDPWPICPQAVSARTRRGSCAPRSPTTCCAPSASWPAVLTRWPAEPHCAAASSPSRPGWPGLNAARSCTYPVTGPGHTIGSLCGATPSDTAHQPPSTL